MGLEGARRDVRKRTETRGRDHEEENKKEKGRNNMDKKLIATAIVAMLMIGSVGVFASASLTGKNATSIALTPASSIIEKGESIHIDGKLRSGGGIPDAMVTLMITKPDGTSAYPVQGANVRTDSSGDFDIDYVPATVGTYKFTAAFSETASYQGCSVITQVTVEENMVDDKKDTTIAMTLVAYDVTVGKNMHASGQLSGTSGIAGATVTLSVKKPDGSFANPSQGKSVVTDSSGKFSVDYVPTVKGSYEFTASFAGNDEYKGSTSTVYFTANKDDPVPVPDICDKPWPSKIDMIEVPSSMIAGETYTFKCQLLVKTYDVYCKESPWLPGVDAEITWTFKNSNGVSVSIESTSSLKDGIATVEFPCYMAGQWSVEAHFPGNAKYMKVDGHATTKATGNTVYWHGLWITVEKWYITADPTKYPTDFGWNIGNTYDPVFVLLKVKNAQNTINRNMNVADLYVTDTDGNAYWGMSGRFIGTNQFTSGLAAGAEAKVWVCFWVPNTQSLVINGLFGVVYTSYDWYYQNLGYIGPTTYNVNIPLPVQSPA